jgi:hypothetical protein
MVVYDERGNVEEKLGQILSCGYELLGYFELDEKTWWNEYFAPLEKLILETRKKFTDSTVAHKGLHDAQRELDMFKENPERNSSACFVMQKR